jgi:UrcA family protein
MKIINPKTLAAALVFSTLSGVSAISHAEIGNANVATMRVSFADLDLTKTEGQEVLKRRVRGAARQVCGQAYSKSAGDLSKNHDCRQYAALQALRQVGLQEELTVAVNAR